MAPIKGLASQTQSSNLYKNIRITWFWPDDDLMSRNMSQNF